MTDTVPAYDRQLVRGDCFTVTVTYTDSDGVAVNLTGYDAEFGVYDLGGGTGGTHWLGGAATGSNATVTGAGKGTVTINATGGIITGTAPKATTVLWLVQKKSAEYQLAILEPPAVTGGAYGCRTTLLTGFVEVKFGAVPSAGG
jgi:hypothetical protein